jgi:L-ascorbate 6-phosphate lactonase
MLKPDFNVGEKEKRRCMKTGLELIKDINECTVTYGEVAFWWLGQMGYAIKIGSTILYIDSYLEDNERRSIPPLLEPSEVINADVILGTHDHSDHIDRSSWNQMSKSSPNAKFITPNLVLSSVPKDLNMNENRFIGLNDGISVNLCGITITGIASAHELLNQDEKTGEYPCLGYIIEGNGVKIYHAGDTCIYPNLYEKLKGFGHFDAIFLPINGRDAIRLESNIIGNMTYQEAVDLAGYLEPGLVVPGHYEMFSHNSENPELFMNYLKVKYPRIKAWVGIHGERVMSSLDQR